MKFGRAESSDTLFIGLGDRFDDDRRLVRYTDSAAFMLGVCVRRQAPGHALDVALSEGPGAPVIGE